MTKDILAWTKQCKKLILRHDILLAFVIAVGVIIVGVWLGWKNDKTIPFYPSPHYRYLSPDPLRYLANWDGPDYIQIAKHGYKTLLSAGFYPLYPLLIRGFYYIFRSYLVSALFVSWSSLVGAIYFYIKIIRKLQLVDDQSSRWMPVLLFVLFPTGVFLIAAYTESLYAMLALGSIYFTLKKRHVSAGVLLLLANITHITGIFLIVLDGLLLFEEKVRLRKIAVTVLMGAFGSVAFMVFLTLRYHDAFAYFQSQTMVHGWLAPGYHHLITSASFFNLLFTVLLICAAKYYWRTRKSFSVYALLFLLIPIMGKQWGGFDRYVLMAFPVQWMLYEKFKDKQQTFVIVIALTAILWTYTLLLYAAGYIGS
jgi:Gpi18-like mannosyltransferase